MLIRGVLCLDHIARNDPDWRDGYQKQSTSYPVEIAVRLWSLVLTVHLWEQAARYALDVDKGIWSRECHGNTPTMGMLAEVLRRLYLPR